MNAVPSQTPADESQTDALRPAGACLVDASGIELPLAECRIEATAAHGVAEVVLRQRFENRSEHPMRVEYRMPLPADAAVGGYAFTVGDRRIVGRIEDRAAAREQFEQAMLEGKTAGLVDQERSSVFTQELGNIPPGAAIECELTLDQPLRWLEEGAWGWRFPTVLGPRYMGEPGRVPDAERISHDVSATPMPVRVAMKLQISDEMGPDAVRSVTHGIRAVQDGSGMLVELADPDGAALNRDIEVTWRVGQARPGIGIEVARQGADSALREGAYGLLTIVPPASPEAIVKTPRDLILLIDTSGSMTGAPLRQAQAICEGLIRGLSEHDTLEMIEYSSRPQRWKSGAAPATAESVQAAIDWVRALKAGGGTEMEDGVREAIHATPNPTRMRQVVLLSDGYVGFERDVIRAIQESADRRFRLHSIGIGPAPNRSLTAAVARAGGGREYLIGLDEDPQTLIERVHARLAAPLVTYLRISGPALLEPASRLVPDLMGGSPALIPLRLNPAGGMLMVHGRTAQGEWTERLVVPSSAPGTGRGSVIRLFGRERVEDLETLSEINESHDELIRTTALRHGIASRLTSWVAIEEVPSVDPRDPVRRVRMPQELPAGLSAEGLGLRRVMRLGILYADASSASSPQTVYTCFDEADCIADPQFHDQWPLLTRRPAWQSEREHARREQSAAARVVLRASDRIVIEITASEPIDWFPSYIWVQGIGRVGMDWDATTRNGRHGSGTTIRLVMVRKSGFPADAAIQMVRITMRQGDARQLLLEVATA